MRIISLEGFFDGYEYHTGPLSVEIDDGIISNIEYSVEWMKNEDGIDGRGMIASVPFHDAHTHAIFSGDRFNELDLKLRGMSYSDILAMGGGIQLSMKHSRQASDEVLINHLMRRLDTMMEHGTLMVEIKTGYALDHENEIRHLRILQQVRDQHPVGISITYGGAHIPPPDMNREEYLDKMINHTLPLIARDKLADAVDVFCDKGAFSVEETINILDRARELDIRVRVHAEEFQYTGIAQVAAKEYSALSADHLLQATREDFEVLSEFGTVATFMPLAPIGLFSNDYPQGWKDTDVIIALGSDFNPNNWVVSMLLAIQMAVYRYKMRPLRAMQAATSGSFKGITGNEMPRLKTGGEANLLLLEAKSIEEMCSKIGQNLIRYVIKSGEVLFHNKNNIC